MKPFQRKDRGGWFYRYKDARGTWVTRKGGETEREAWYALERVERRVQAIADGLIDERELEILEASRRPIEDVLQEYERYHRAKRNTEMHVKQVMRCCHAVIAFTKAKCLADIDVRSVESFLADLLDRGRSHRTHNVYLIRLSGLLNWAERRQLIGRNCLTAIDTLSTAVDQREKSRAITPEEFRRLLDSTTCPTRRLYYMLAGRTGLRWGEIRRLRWGDIDLDNGWIQLRAEATKARRGDPVPLTKEVCAALRDKSAGFERGSVFDSSPTLRTFKRDIERAAIDYDTSDGQADRKALRKTFGTHLAMANVPLHTTSKLMRHGSVQMTLELYTDPRLLDLKGSVERLIGVGSSNSQERKLRDRSLSQPA